jgi:hypothetical protein
MKYMLLIHHGEAPLPGIGVGAALRGRAAAGFRRLPGDQLDLGRDSRRLDGVARDGDDGAG